MWIHPELAVHVLGVQAAVLLRLIREGPLVNSFDYGTSTYLLSIYNLGKIVGISTAGLALSRLLSRIDKPEYQMSS